MSRRQVVQPAASRLEQYFDAVETEEFWAPIQSNNPGPPSLDATANTNKGTYTFFYKNLIYKNIKASNCPKIKNISRTYEGFKS